MNRVAGAEQRKACNSTVQCGSRTKMNQKLRFILPLMVLLFLVACTETNRGQANQVLNPTQLKTPFINEPDRAELIILNITVPTIPLQKGRYTFPMIRFNKGPKKCCEAKTQTIIYKGGRNLGGSGIFETEACAVNPSLNPGGFEVGETRTNMGTMYYNYNESGTYQIRATIECEIPQTRTRLLTEYWVNVSIE